MEEKYGIHFTEEILTAPGFGPLTREVVDTVQSVLDMNDPVGIAAGYYTDRLPIVCASRFFVEMLGYERERLGQEPGLKLEDIICTTLRYPFEKRDFSALWGKFRVYMLTRKGTAVPMTCFKEETRDAQERPMWVISARPSRTEQYLDLVEDIREISQWYIDYDLAGQVVPGPLGRRSAYPFGRPARNAPARLQGPGGAHPSGGPAPHPEGADRVFL